MCENKNYQCLRVDCKLNLTEFFLKWLTAHDLFTIKVKTKNKETNSCSPLDYILSLQHSSCFFFTVFVWFVFDLSLKHTCTCKILILIAQAQVYATRKSIKKFTGVYVHVFLSSYVYIYHDGSKFSLLMNVFAFKFTKVHNKTVFSCPNGFSPNIKRFHQRKQEEFTCIYMKNVRFFIQS